MKPEKIAKLQEIEEALKDFDALLQDPLTDHSKISPKAKAQIEQIRSIAKQHRQALDKDAIAKRLEGVPLDNDIPKKEYIDVFKLWVERLTGKLNNIERGKEGIPALKNAFPNIQSLLNLGATNPILSEMADELGKTPEAKKTKPTIVDVGRALRGILSQFLKDINKKFEKNRSFYLKLSAKGFSSFESMFPNEDDILACISDFKGETGEIEIISSDFVQWIGEVEISLGSLNNVPESIQSSIPDLSSMLNKLFSGNPEVFDGFMQCIEGDVMQTKAVVKQMQENLKEMHKITTPVQHFKLTPTTINKLPVDTFIIKAIENTDSDNFPPQAKEFAQQIRMALMADSLEISNTFAAIDENILTNPSAIRDAFANGLCTYNECDGIVVSTILSMVFRSVQKECIPTMGNYNEALQNAVHKINGMGFWATYDTKHCQVPTIFALQNFAKYVVENKVNISSKSFGATYSNWKNAEKPNEWFSSWNVTNGTRFRYKDLMENLSKYFLRQCNGFDVSKGVFEQHWLPVLGNNGEYNSKKIIEFSELTAFWEVLWNNLSNGHTFLHSLFQTNLKATCDVVLMEQIHNNWTDALPHKNDLMQALWASLDIPKPKVALNNNTIDIYLNYNENGLSFRVPVTLTVQAMPYHSDVLNKDVFVLEVIKANFVKSITHNGYSISPLPAIDIGAKSIVEKEENVYSYQDIKVTLAIAQSTTSGTTTTDPTISTENKVEIGNDDYAKYTHTTTTTTGGNSTTNVQNKAGSYKMVVTVPIRFNWDMITKGASQFYSEINPDRTVMISGTPPPDFAGDKINAGFSGEIQVVKINE